MPDRNKLIRAVKVAQKVLGLDDGTYRDLLINVTGKDSCAKLTEKELSNVLSYLRAAGFQPADNPATRSQRGLIAVIWREMANDGVVHDASPHALNAYVRRICKGVSLEALSGAGCSRVIESLKRWVKRAGSAELCHKVFVELCTGAI